MARRLQKAHSYLIRFTPNQVQTTIYTTTHVKTLLKELLKVIMVRLR